MASNLGPVESEFYVKMAYDAMRSMLHDRFTSCGNALIIYIVSDFKIFSFSNIVEDNSFIYFLFHANIN